jgi:hypothetical protein
LAAVSSSNAPTAAATFRTVSAYRPASTVTASRLDKVRVIEHRAAEHAERIRRQADEEAAVARVQARGEVVRLLDAGREQRRRADAEAAAIRDRQNRDAAARTTSLLAQVAALAERRDALRAEVELLAAEQRLRRAEREPTRRRPRASAARALHQLAHDVRRVVSHTVQEGRVAAMLILRTDDEEARLQRAAAVLGDGTRSVTDGHVQPGVVWAVPGGPDDRPDALAVQP